MVINGVNSNCVPSGVPQDSVLGPVFLSCVEQVKSRVRLFADDTPMCLAYDLIPPNARSFMILA